MAENMFEPAVCFKNNNHKPYKQYVHITYMPIQFIHQISKGSKYNQIYIPQEMRGLFEPGSLVKVVLLKKKASFYSSKNLPNLGEFKESLIKKIFQILGKLHGIEQIFVVGSFLTKHTDYKDIDLLVICNKSIIGDKISSILAEKIGISFHILAVSDSSFRNLTETCPLIRSMLYFFVSNKPLSLPKKTSLDKKHLNFLLMMPQDLLKINASSRAFYDSLRRLITIQRFLESRSLNALEIEDELKTFLKDIFLIAKNNEPLTKKSLDKLRELIKLKLKLIDRLIKKWERKN